MSNPEHDGCSPLPEVVSARLEKLQRRLASERDWKSYIGERASRDQGYIESNLQIILRYPEQFNRIFEERAIRMLVSSSDERLPFYTAGIERNWSSDPIPQKVRESLTRDQAEILASILPGRLKGLRKELDWRNSATVAPKIDYFNDLIIDLLPNISHESAFRLIGSFDIRDAVPVDDGSGRSGYNPLERLVLDPRICDELKIVGVGQIHGIIARECRQMQTPRVECERASRCFARIIEKVVDSENLPVSPEFIEDMVAVAASMNSGEPVVRVEYTEKVLQYLEDYTREHYIEQQVTLYKSKNTPYYRITSQEQAEFAQRLLEEFSDNERIVKCLTRRLKAWEKRSA